jgi:hypothetical protein
MRHVEVHLIKGTTEDLRLAEMAGLIDEKINTCQICSAKLVFIYVLISEDQSITSCEYCLKAALNKALM